MKKNAFLLLCMVAATVLSLACERAKPVTVANEAEEKQQAMGGAGAFECKELYALIPVTKGKPITVEGDKCPDNKAVVNGWSLLCVPEEKCDTAKRLAELNQAAEEFCAQWCSKKSCDYSYSKHDKCDFKDCNESESCKSKCDAAPFHDSCFFTKAAPDYNCQCKDKIQG